MQKQVSNYKVHFFCFKNICVYYITIPSSHFSDFPSTMRYFYLVKHSYARQNSLGVPSISSTWHIYFCNNEKYNKFVPNLQCHLRRFNHHIAESETVMGFSYSKYKIIVKVLNTSGRKDYIWFKLSTVITSTKITKSKKQWSFFDDAPQLV